MLELAWEDLRAEGPSVSALAGLVIFLTRPEREERVRDMRPPLRGPLRESGEDERCGCVRPASV